MRLSADTPRKVAISIREQLSGVLQQSERTLLIGTILLMSAVAAATSFVLTQYFSKDVITSLFYLRDDCRDDMVKGVGRHCFTDYADLVALMQQPDPWHHYFVSSTGVYSAAALMPFRLFALLGSWLGVPQLVLFGYLIALTMAVLTPPAFWAARGARGLERLVIFVACGAAAIPALVDVDRGNSTGFVVPIMLVFLIALCRQRWGGGRSDGDLGCAGQTTVRLVGSCVTRGSSMEIGRHRGRRGHTIQPRGVLAADAA
ncbi:hypothetical protein [Mycobacterium kiyosense]|nr:hypothetical protein IWGMT90018_34570 [Mycobacterium kiyosense]